MCIRDRGVLVHGDQHRHPAALHVGRADRVPGRLGRDHHHVCLLYTSDAADERSSVDLGGRRIIKKKKQEEGRLQRGNTQTDKKQLPYQTAYEKKKEEQ